MARVSAASAYVRDQISRTARARKHSHKKIVNVKYARPGAQVRAVEALTIELHESPNIPLLNRRYFAAESKPPELREQDILDARDPETLV